jgi:hypothetical protein
MKANWRQGAESRTYRSRTANEDLTYTQGLQLLRCIGATGISPNVRERGRVELSIRRDVIQKLLNNLPVKLLADAIIPTV